MKNIDKWLNDLIAKKEDVPFGCSKECPAHDYCYSDQSPKELKCPEIFKEWANMEEINEEH